AWRRKRLRPSVSNALMHVSLCFSSTLACGVVESGYARRPDKCVNSCVGRSNNRVFRAQRA
ncbi:hypothetical protein LZB92_09735, partial [Campylobacter jejuni]